MLGEAHGVYGLTQRRTASGVLGGEVLKHSSPL
jgi:hypothetical protein